MKAVIGQNMAGIEIVNRKNGRCAHGKYVARPSLLGNPYSVGRDGTRLEVIAKYRDWLRTQYKTNHTVRKALYNLASEYVTTGKLTLVCWCAPQTCHAQVIRDAVIGIVQKGREH